MNILDTELHLAITENDEWNTMLWDEEDLARRTKVSDSEIAQNKRNIDRYNQNRNDAIRRIDEVIANILTFKGVEIRSDARLSSETPGQMYDRLSILNLKFKAAVSLRLLEKSDAVIAQHQDLRLCLDRLLEGCECGTDYFKLYHAHKLYNDPTTNPELIKENASQNT